MSLYFKSLLGFVMMSSVSVFAAQADQSQASTPVVTAPITSLEGSSVYIAPVWEFLNSKWGNNTNQNGSLYGGSAGYTYTERDSIFFNAEFSYMAGMLRGSAGNDPTQEYITEIRLGYDLSSPFGERFSVTPFVGMGSYIFNQSLSGGLCFRSHFWYVPIGVALNYRIDKNWNLGFTGSGSPTFSGRWSVEHTQEAPTSALWRAELPITYLGGSSFELSLIPFAKGWSYCPTDELTQQKNTYYGLKLACGYRF